MAHLTEKQDVPNNLKKAWKILFPACVEQEAVHQDSFGLGPTQSCTPDKFYKILCLWWNQELKLADISQLETDHLPLLSRYLGTEINTESQDQKMNDSNLDSISDSNLSSSDPISDYLGFYQPKNGTCGFVAAMHAILLYKMWDQVIQQSMEQSMESNVHSVPKPRYDLKYLMASSVAHALVTAANAASSKIEYDPNSINIIDSKNNKPAFWNCVYCGHKNNAQNAFCEECFKEPPPPQSQSDDPMDVDNEEPKKDDSKSTVTIDPCSQIVIVTSGELPCESVDNASSFYNEELFNFKIHRIEYDPSSDLETATMEIADYLLRKTDFKNDFLSNGSCVRILLSLIFTHGLDRCEYESVIDEYPEIFRQFRDESLVVGPYGFCSQNLVNLTMFGHCKPMIDAPSPMSYHFGFLGHDVINPAATGFFQTGYGYEYPLYPIWVVLSGTHYTTLFGLPTHIQKYNGEHVLDCYHAMVQWMTADEKRKDVDGKIRGKEKKKKKKNNTINVSSNDGDINMEDNGTSDVLNKGTGTGTESGSGNDQNTNNNNKNSNSSWKCDLCGNLNDANYVFCSQCAREKSKAVAVDAIISGVDGGGGGDKGNGTNYRGNEADSEWRCTFCGQVNDKDHVLCANISCLQERVCPTIPEKGGKNTESTQSTESAKVERKEAEEEDEDDDDDEDEEDAVHFEVDLLCYNGLPPSGPLLAPISMKVITEKQSDSDKLERERVIAAEEVISVVDEDEPDESKKIKYLKGHGLVQRMESKLRKNVYFYEIAISLESHFEEIQNWKSPYFMKIKDEEEWNGIKSFFNAKIVPNLDLKTYEYPSMKWRCCSCYLGDDMSKKYAGYNELDSGTCKACGKPMYEALRSLIVKYEHVPFYIRESRVDKNYQNALVKLLNKRFRNLVNADVDNDCLPVI